MCSTVLGRGAKAEGNTTQQFHLTLAANNGEAEARDPTLALHEWVIPGARRCLSQGVKVEVNRMKTQPSRVYQRQDVHATCCAASGVIVHEGAPPFVVDACE